MRRALVVGGGVAGSVAAMALERVGIRTVICEAAEDIVDGDDLALTVASNGLDALAALELDSLVRASGIVVDRSLFVDHAGRTLGALALGIGTEEGGVERASHVLRRARLRRLLLEEAERRGVQIELGKRLVDVTERGGGVVARFADESEAEADLVVGADGLASFARRVVDPEAAAPRYAGWVTFAGATEGTVSDTEAATWTLVLGRRALFAYVAEDDLGTLWQVHLPRPQIDDEERESVSSEEWQDRLVDLFSDAEGPARELVAGGRLERVAENAFEMPALRRWHAGRVVLVGDAAHVSAPSSGQGASMACEDAVTLARCVRDLEEPERAFRAYQAVRRPRAQRVVREGRRGSLRSMPGALGRVLRNGLLRMALGRWITARSLAWLYEHHIDWEAPVNAPPEPLRVRRERRRSG